MLLNNCKLLLAHNKSLTNIFYLEYFMKIKFNDCKSNYLHKLEICNYLY